jgi:hypothetical protein
MSATGGSAIRLIGRVYGATALATALVALLTAVAAAPAARRLLGFSFGAVPASFSEVLVVLLHNLRLLLIPAGASLAISWQREHNSRSVIILCDALVAGAALANVAIVGIGLGAYGMRMARAIMPHGPIELAAFAAGTTLYLLARRAAVTRVSAAAMLSAAVGALAVAAPLEVFLSP